MGRGITQDALANSGTANRMSGNYTSAAANIGNSLVPQLQAQATNPQGYSPAQMAAMNTASQQALGGAVAGATGQGNLEAARTRNSGGYAAAIDQASRQAMQQGSQNALGVQEANANLEQKKQAAALQALQGLYGTNAQAGLNALGLSNQALGVGTGSAAQTTNAALGWGNLATNALGLKG